MSSEEDPPPTVESESAPAPSAEAAAPTEPEVAAAEATEAAEPATAEPATAEPATAEPATAEPATTEPADAAELVELAPEPAEVAAEAVPLEPAEDGEAPVGEAPAEAPEAAEEAPSDAPTEAAPVEAPPVEAAPEDAPPADAPPADAAPGDAPAEDEPVEAEKDPSDESLPTEDVIPESALLKAQPVTPAPTEDAPPATPSAPVESEDDKPTSPAQDEGTRVSIDGVKLPDFQQPATDLLPLPAESKVDTATAQDGGTLISEDDSGPLTMKWSFGINASLPVLNLFDGQRTVVSYACAHVAVLYDYVNQQQALLQGHMTAISCMDCSADKRWIVTGDQGPNATLIVWDSYTGIPVQTIFDVSEKGIVACAMTADAKYVATICEGPAQTVTIWDWTNSSDAMHSVTLDPHHSGQLHISFHVENNFMLVSNSDTQVIFYSWADGALQHDAPFLSDITFNRTVGRYTSSLFQAAPSRHALSATTFGNLVVWADTRATELKGRGSSFKRRPLKLVRVNARSITSLSHTIEGMIVTGDTAGHLRFYDDRLNLLYWFQSLKLGPISFISFDSCLPGSKSQILEQHHEFPADATIKAFPFVIPNFFVATSSGEVVMIQPDGQRVTNVLKESNAPTDSLAASPTKPWICMGSSSGLLKVWDYELKSTLATRIFPGQESIRCIAYSHDGLLIAIGLGSGQVSVLEALSLGTEAEFHYAKCAITHCAFSHNSAYLATADEGLTTSLFVFNKQWSYLGRYAAHYDVINDLIFGVDHDTNACRLLTLGNDRKLVEYDLKHSSKDDLKLHSIERIEQSATPLCITWYPPVTKESFLLEVNSHFKVKLYNSTTKLCRKTFLGPTYGTPVRLMQVVPQPEGSDPSQDRILCYATDNKLGLQLLPLDGNPHRSIAVMAHPAGVSRIACSHDGKVVFASGVGDGSVHMWSINTEALDAVSMLGGEGLVPFYGLLEGGREGALFAEIENYFYYAQLRSQGEHTTDEREVSAEVELDQVPYLMRALGFYPSEQEIEDIVNEVKFSNYVETSEYVTKIDLADFIKLYINHRPAFGLSSDVIEKAFATLTSSPDEMDRDQFIALLQQQGEHMTFDELAECLYLLLGSEKLDEQLRSGSVTSGKHDITSPLPETITSGYLVNQLLALNAYEEEVV